MKETINYEEAIALQELGFNESCIYVYLDKDTIRQNCGFMNYPKEIYTDVVKAPLYQQAFRFFRKKYKLDSNYGTTSDSDENAHGYIICNFINGRRNHLCIDWEVGTYEEAELECLKKLIEISAQNKTEEN